MTTEHYERTTEQDNRLGIYQNTPEEEVQEEKMSEEKGIYYYNRTLLS